MEKSENIAEVHSEEVSRILGLKPKWLIRNGMILTFSVFVILALIASDFEVPVIIKVPVTVSRASGKNAARFFVNKTQGLKIKTGQHLLLKLTRSGQYIYGFVSETRFPDTGDSYFVQVKITSGDVKNKADTASGISAVINDTAEIQVGYESLLRRFFTREASN